MRASPVVELHGVSKRFGERLAVDGLDLDIPTGACFGILGPNGAGKTTTLRMIYGAADPSAGTVRVFGTDVAHGAREVRARLGVTLQEDVLIDELSCVDNLRVFGRYHLLREPELGRRVEELLDFLELRSHARVPVEALSGGFRRRLSIAMSLINRPELLILDEPTTGLDPAVRLALWSRIRELRARGTTVLLTTHYMDEAQRLCDEVAIMSEGAVVARGSPGALIDERLAREVVEIDCAPREEPALLDGLEIAARLRAGSRLLLYVHDPTPVVDRVHLHGGAESRGLVARPTNLEDVFLATTGTRLGELP